jgi:hypothetical protein
VTTYRVYCLDGTGKIATAEWLEAEDDADALAQVRERNRPLRCELWERERFVGAVDPAAGTTPA